MALGLIKDRRKWYTVDFADRLDMMDDDCDIEGFPNFQESKNDGFWGRACARAHKKIRELENEYKSLFNGVLKPLDKEGWPDENRDTQNGICPSCKNEIANITPRYRKLTGCRFCGAVIDWR